MLLAYTWIIFLQLFNIIRLEKLQWCSWSAWDLCNLINLLRYIAAGLERRRGRLGASRCFSSVISCPCELDEQARGHVGCGVSECALCCTRSSCVFLHHKHGVCFNMIQRGGSRDWHSAPSNAHLAIYNMNF